MPSPAPTFKKIRAMFVEDYGEDPGEPCPTMLAWVVVFIVVLIVFGIFSVFVGIYIQDMLSYQHIRLEKDERTAQE